MFRHRVKGALLIPCALVAGCFGGTGQKDELRNPVAATGISVALQVNLAQGASSADAAASIYKDGVRQPLVGGDFFMATSAGRETVLKSVENLGGDYHGIVAVASNAQAVSLSTEYDPERARQDRWYPVDELLIDPGPNEDLVGYSQTVNFPVPLANLAIGAATYTARTDNVVLTWDADNGEQMNTTAIVTCHSGDGKSYTFPRFNVLGNVDAAGTFSLTVGQIIPSTNIINAVATITNEIATLITSALLSYSTYGLVSAKNIPLSTFVVQTCDVDLTVFREIGFDLPDNVSGGYAVSSTSDTVHFTFQP